MSSDERLRGHSDQALVALSEQQREAFPTVIYRHESEAATANAILTTALAAARQAGLQLVGDVMFNEESGRHEAVVRSAATDRWEPKIESALFHGATVITERTVDALSRDGIDTAEALQTAQATTEVLIRQVTDNKALNEAFRSYYGGLRWGTDQEKFTQSLFEAAAELDLDSLPQQLTTGSDVMHVLHDLDLDLPWERTRHWYDKKAEEVFAEAPELDFRQLTDPEFAATEAGQRLAEAYRRLSGYQAGHLYKQYPRPITDEGEVVPKPPIPLAKFPIIEALIVDEVSLSRPKMKYDMGPQEVVDFILHSDSLPAQQALVGTVTRRLPEQQRYVFDGPNEFEHKRYIIRGLTQAYQTETDPVRHDNFKHQILEVFDAYTGDGEMASALRAQHRDEELRGLTWHRDTGQVKDIIRDLLVVGLASPDADAFAGRYMPDFENGLALEGDPLALTQTDMMMVVLDALNAVDGRSIPAIFEHIGRKVFQDEAIATTIREIAELEREASMFWQTPAVKLAFKARDRFRYLGLDERKTNPDFLAADAAYEEALAPSKAKGELAREKKNKLILDYLTNMAEADVLGENEEMNGRLFNLLVDRISYGDTWHLRSLPKAQVELMKLADHPNVPDDLRAHILWKFAESVKYSDDEAARILVGVILEGYRLMLGDPEALRLPGPQTERGLAALNYIASNNPVFKYASEAQLMTLSRYKAGIIMMAEQVAAGQLTDGTEQSTSGQVLDEWQVETLKNLKEAMDEIKRLEEKYREYLHIEDVKVKPHVFYPWLMQSFMPFWYRLRREVGPDYRPSHDLRQLHAVMKDHVENLLVLQDGEYSEDFDVIEDGHLDSLLIEGYERMVVPNDIKYNNVVYHDGLSFMHAAVVYMPESVVEQLRAKHGSKKAFIDYLEKSRAYWRKAETE